MVQFIPITNKCNQLCLYCAAHGRGKPAPKKRILEQIEKAKDHLIITGGEPLLDQNLLTYIKKAKKKGLYIELQSNGTLFCYSDIAKKTVNAGVDLFNIAMQSHKQSTYDKLTQTKGLLPKKIKGIKNLLKLGAKVRITFVINKVNYTELEEFSKFVLKNFENLFLLEFNFTKAIGLAKNNKKMVPKYENVSLHLIKALQICEGKVKVLIDHIPLCYIPGFEKNHADVFKIMNQENMNFFKEKAHVKNCRNCTLNKICLGPRKDYIEIYPTAKVIPKKINPEAITKNMGSLSVVTINNADYSDLINQDSQKYRFKLGQNISKPKKLINSIFHELDKLIESNTSFELQDFPICIFRPYKRYIVKKEEQTKIKMCRDCTHNKQCSGFNPVFLDSNNKPRLKILTRSSLLTDNEKCMIKILEQENNITTDRLLELTPNFKICADCAGGANVIQAGHKMIKHGLVEKKLIKTGYVWKLIKNEN